MFLTNYIKQNLQFLSIILIWVISGIVAGNAAIAIVGVTVLLMKRSGMKKELLFGFFIMLILSDSRNPNLEFAKNAKNIYLVLLWLFYIFDTKNFRNFPGVIKYFIPFFVIAFLCLIYSPVPLSGLQKTISYLFVMGIVPIYVFTMFIEEKEKSLKDLIMFGALLLLVGLILKLLSPGVVHLNGRFTGVLGNPNGLGVFCLLFFMLFTVVKRFFNEQFSKAENTYIHGVIFLSLILSGSRSAVLGVIIFLVFSYFYKMSPFLGFLLFLMFLFGYQFITENFVPIVLYLGLEEFFRIETLEDGSGRVIAWKFAWEHIDKNVFLGQGFSFTEYLYKKNYSMLSRLGHQGNAHNSFLTIWLDTGLIGLICFAFGFLASFIKAARYTPLAIPVMYAVIFSANFESWLIGSLNPITIQVWLILSILLIVPGYRDEQVAETEEPLDVHRINLSPA